MPCTKMMVQNNNNTQQAIWLVIGQSFTFLMAFFSAPILSRYFDKTDYGTYRQILYIYTNLYTLFVMGLPNIFLYFIPRLDIRQQKMFVQRITMFLFLIGVVFSITLCALSGFIAKLLNNPELAVGLRIFSVFPMFTLPAMGVEGIYTSIKRTKEVAVYQVLSRLFMFLCIVLPVIVCNTGYKEAIIGWGVASFLTFLVAIYMKRKPYRGVKSERIPNMYQEISSRIMPLFCASVASFFLRVADSFYVSRYYGTETFAELSNGCFSIPIVTILVGSLNSVLLPVMSEADAHNKIPSALNSYTNAVKKISTIVIPLLMFCFFFADEIMITLFGSQYESSASYFRVYMLRDFTNLFPFFIIMMAFGFQKAYMNIFIGGVVFTWIADYLLVVFFMNPIFITVVSTIFRIASVIIGQIYIYKKMGITFIPRSVLFYIVKILAHSFVILLLISAVRYMAFPGVNRLVSVIVFALLFYVLLIPTGKFVKIDYATVLENVPLLGKLKKKLF